MLNLKSGIVIRYCLERAFLINIYTNKIVGVSAKAAEYLENEIDKGLTLEKVKGKGNSHFETMVHKLITEGILEETNDES